MELGLPERAGVDVLHIAFAVGFAMDYLLTWNCAHIANGAVVRRLFRVNDKIGKPTPVIVTPEEIFEGVKEDEVSTLKRTSFSRRYSLRG